MSSMPDMIRALEKAAEENPGNRAFYEREAERWRIEAWRHKLRQEALRRQLERTLTPAELVRLTKDVGPCAVIGRP